MATHVHAVLPHCVHSQAYWLMASGHEPLHARYVQLAPVASAVGGLTQFAASLRSGPLYLPVSEPPGTMHTSSISKRAVVAKQVSSRAAVAAVLTFRNVRGPCLVDAGLAWNRHMFMPVGACNRNPI